MSLDSESGLSQAGQTKAKLNDLLAHSGQKTCEQEVTNAFEVSFVLHLMMLHFNSKSILGVYFMRIFNRRVLLKSSKNTK
jgi:hypothetical protein